MTVELSSLIKSIVYTNFWYKKADYFITERVISAHVDAVYSQGC